MSPQEAFERVVASLHEAAFDDKLWDRTSALIDEACRSMGNQVVVRDGSSELTGVLFARFCLRGQRHREAELEYYQRYFATDEHVPRLWRLSAGRIVHVTELYSEHELKTSLTYNEGMARSHAQDALKVRLDGPDRSRIFWSIGDPVDADGWSSAHVDMIARLQSHLRQFVRVRHALVQAQALGQSLGTLLDNDRVGVVQLDRRGRIAAANDVAVEFLRQSDGLFDEGGVLRAIFTVDDKKLQGLLGRAISPFGVPPESGSMAVARRNPGLPLVLHVSPVRNPESDCRPQDAAALVLIVDLRRHARLDRGLVAGVLGLTPAESEVAVLLAEGRTLSDIAYASGRSTATIQSHLKRIFNKLGVGRQADVIRIILAVRAISKSP